MAEPERHPSHLPRPGVTFVGDDTIFCVYAGHADAVELCFFQAGGEESRLNMAPAGRGYWAVAVPGVSAGQHYGYRAHGPWDPRSGHRYNPDKLSLDPYTRAASGWFQLAPEVFGHAVGADFHGDASVKDHRDSAPFVPRSVVTDERKTFDWGEDAPPHTPMSDSLIYELHVGGYTRLREDVPAKLRGTYAGLAHPNVVGHLKALGVTAVELLPVHAFVDEPHLVKLGLRNYWGYNTLGFFAPHAGYAIGCDAVAAVSEFKAMVKALHEAGIEVILDVVYNHTAEQGGHEGPMLSLRGLDNHAYYRLDESGQDIDVTGCGNSVDTRDVPGMQLVLDSLRYWVEEMHVDGFRFDLAVTLGRGPGDDYDADNALFLAMRTDPVLSRVKLIAEPWDIGMHGWRTGQFPDAFSEWNDRFRNTVRDFWLGDVARSLSHERGHGVADLATRLAGSQDLFDDAFREPTASINYVTAHDGFTLADLVTYDEKHNLANGEQGRDGTTDNRSWNHGVEGLTDDPAVAERRRRSMRNVLGTLLLSAGVPMLTAGDEFGRSQQGNNNAYCQDSEISWVNWQLDDAATDLLTTTRALVRLRQRFPVLRHSAFFPGSTTVGDPAADLRWFDARGCPMTPAEWENAHARTLQAFFDAGQEHPDSVLLVLHGSVHATDVTLPDLPGVSGWNLVWDSVSEHPDATVQAFVHAGGTRHTEGASMQVFTALR